jgi:hypothetical protein
VSFSHDVVNFGWEFISTHSALTIPLIITAVIVFLLWFFVPTIAMAGTMQSIARAKNGQKSGVGVGLKYGLMAFLPLIEYHAMVGTFSPVTAVTEMGFVIRNLGPEIFKFLFIPFLVFFFVGLFLRLLFAYADLFIIIDGDGPLTAIRKSSKLVFLNWQHTILITILMIMIGARIIIQALLVFLIPGAIILLGAYFASLALNTALLITLGIVGVAALLLTSYLNGIVDIFSYAVWTVTFLELTSEKQVSARESVETSSPREQIVTAPVVTIAEPTVQLSPDENIPGLL